jgi:hypothetical protein
MVDGGVFMSLLNRFFGNRNPIERYGGTDRLAKDISDICHRWTNSVLDKAGSQIENFDREDRMKHAIVIHITLLTLVMRELCKHAELWAPKEPQKFVDDLCACVARHEWGGDVEMYNSMFKSISMLIQAMISDEQEEKLGKIESSARIFRACYRTFDLAGENKFLTSSNKYSLPLAMAIASYYPECMAVNKHALEVINAVNKDGVYVG